MPAIWLPAQSICPVATGGGSANVLGLPTDCQMCCGRMLTWPMRNRFAYCGAAKFRVTELPDEVALVGTGVAGRLSAGFLMIRLKVYATSAAENALPSLHFTPGRMVRASVLPPFDQV